MRRSLLLASLSLTLARALGAQASATLRPTDAAHRDLSRLAALGYLDTLLLGQRPLTRATVERALREAAVRVEADTGARQPVGREILRRLAWDSTAGMQPLRSGTLDLTTVDGSRRRLLDDNGLGGIEAHVDPFLGSREGREIGEGATLSLETLHELSAGRVLTLVLQPRLALGRAVLGDGARVRGTIERAYARLAVRNLVVQLGRDHLLWGQGPEVGSLFSAGGPALDMVLVGHERPFVFPWLLRWLGPTRLSLAVARLDGGQNFPHPYVAAYKASILPARWLELGAQMYTKGGGRGGPPADFWDRVSDATQLIDVIFRGEDDYQFSDKYAGGDVRLRLPRAAGAELYGEILLNDLDFNRIESSVTEDASHVAGLWLPRLDRRGRLDARLELRHTGIRQYRHHQYTSGQVLRGQLLGDPLGPDARAGYLALGWAAAVWQRVELQLAAEERRADEYVDVTGGARTIDFERSLERPRERRLRAVAQWDAGTDDGARRLLVQLGTERTTHWSNEPDARRTGWLARVGVELRARPRGQR
ncbi:MAG TPA: capsule assembly Wzi family protein [Gemmatimonadaceae bacterium]|nr:capsule assembly Wzi family protein [Gemmatimonadaceae bacterium]